MRLLKQDYSLYHFYIQLANEAVYNQCAHFRRFTGLILCVVALILIENSMYNFLSILNNLSNRMFHYGFSALFFLLHKHARLCEVSGLSLHLLLYPMRRQQMG